MMIKLSLYPAVNESGDLTDPLGLRMAELPVGPMFAKMLLNSGRYYGFLVNQRQLRYILHCFFAKSFSN